MDTKSAINKPFFNVSKSAIFSEDGLYRYVLYRKWDDALPVAQVIGLNPSKADSVEDDPTITFLLIALKKLGFGTLYMTNLFALVSADPEALRTCPDPIKDNDLYLEKVRLLSDDVIFAWGNFKQAEYRKKAMVAKFPGAKCFAKNKNGSPSHPLSLMYKGTVKNPKLIPI